MDREIYRILDANLNRAREGLRVVEEYLRFVKNDRKSTSKLKELRHGLRQIIDKLGHDKILSARKAGTDVGKDIPNPSSAEKTEPEIIALASMKRIQEALRAIEEYAVPIDMSAATIAGKMRFEVYQFEQNLLAENPRRRFEEVRLYLLIGSDFCPQEKIIDLSEKLLDAGVDCLQLREKKLPDCEIYHLADKLAEICKKRNKLFILNDRADIAQAVDADGVHLGQNDLPIKVVEKFFRNDKIFGLSTHNDDELSGAIKLNPTYIAIGPAFDTRTKPHEPAAGLEFMEKALNTLHQENIPEVAIGGITPENLGQLLKIGAKRIAICSSILSAKKPAEQAKKIRLKL